MHSGEVTGVPARGAGIEAAPPPGEVAGAGAAAVTGLATAGVGRTEGMAGGAEAQRSPGGTARLRVDPRHGRPASPYAEAVHLALLTASAISSLPIWAQWISALAPVGTATAVIVAFLAYLQKKRSDDRADWWARAVKAMELMTAEETTSVNAGMALASHIIDSETASDKDRAMFTEVVDRIVDDIIQDSVQVERRVAKEKRLHRQSRSGGFLNNVRTGCPWLRGHTQ